MLPVKEVQMTGNNPVVKEDKDGDVTFTVPDIGQGFTGNMDDRYDT